MGVRIRDLSLRPVWLLLPVVGAVVAATLEPVPPYDYWWHLVMGRLIAVGGEVPATNLFLYTMAADAPFHDQPWLAQWAMYLVYASSGHGGLIVLRNLMVATAMALLVDAGWRRLEVRRGAGALAVGATGLLAVALSYPVLTVRSRVFAFVPFAAAVWILAGLADGRIRRRWAWALLPITALWANVHGSFVLAPVLAGAVATAALVRRWRGQGDASPLFWAAVLAGVVAAGALNPAGLANYAYVLELAVASDVPQTVSEWQPPDPTDPTGILLIATGVLAAGLLIRRRREVRLWELLWLGGTLYMAATAVRSLFWFAALLPVVVAPHLAALLRAPMSSGAPPAARRQEEASGTNATGALHAVLLGGLLVAAVAVQPGVALHRVRDAMGDERVRQRGDGAGVLNHLHPMDLVGRVAPGAGVARVFHDQALGGWLEFHATTARAPRPVAFVDQRMELVPAKVWRDYFTLSEAQPGWERLVEEYELRRFVLSRKEQRPLIEALLRTGRWVVGAEEAAHVWIEPR